MIRRLLTRLRPPRRHATTEPQPHVATSTPPATPAQCLWDSTSARVVPGVSAACSLGHCGTGQCSGCGCGHHTPAAPAPPHLRQQQSEPKEDTSV